MVERHVYDEKDLGFPVSTDARRRLDLEASLFADDGRVRLDTFPQVRRVARLLDRQRQAADAPARQGTRAGDLEALAILDVVYRHIWERFGERANPDVESEAFDELADQLGASAVDGLLETVVEAFPPAPVATGEVSAADYLAADDEDRRRALIDLVCIRLANTNPAADNFTELFDDAEIAAETDYEAVLEALADFFDDQPGFGADDEPLLTMLQAPARRAPNSLREQVEYIQRTWGDLLPDWLRRRMLTTLDVMREEEKAMHFGAPGPHPVEVPDFDGLAADRKRYARDSDWMASLVLVAKNARVWLTQLSRKYEQDISRLQDIPDAELERLARQGIDGLWLIGVWERSDASQRIKRMTGSPEAVSSAYAIDRYRIADDLGGPDGREQLAERAWQYGIRLAADMVPNHMGIDSGWVVDHPDRFLSLDQPPFPGYSFDGADLCDDPDVGIYLEDHYYDQSDAAVVFKRVDHRTGETRYIYHGNDGTSMPWNDTAQIDFLNDEAREAVIEQIVDVARQFPVIRFDAAMTLAKKQIHRLWYPEPGSGGAIPSRAEHGMSRAEFEAVVGEEFWIEVVERIEQEAPDTLLLAEAFWQMEGFFVRSLGMHRVYNSAFMHMLRDEDNAEYRALMKDTLTFDPQILKRYVNFMNNPDEETAIEQFGDGDKYFGICTLMATMPGLPMLGHGQVEGFEEKYGMDFNEPMLDEQPDEGLVERHRREIFPLLHRRKLFSGVENFLLYDVYTPDGGVDENVFAYSNRRDGDRSLVVYHNRYGDTRGWIRESLPYRPEGEGEELKKTLAEGLEVPDDPELYIAFRDEISGLEFLRSASEIARQGMYIELGAYDTHVFVDFREIRDHEGGEYARLCDHLAGRGVDNLDAELRRMRLEPVHRRARQFVNTEVIDKLGRGADLEPTERGDLVETGRRGAEALAEAVRDYDGTELPDYPAETADRLAALLDLPALADELGAECAEVLDEIGGLYPETTADVGALVGWTVAAGLDWLADERDRSVARGRFEGWGLGDLLARTISAAGADGDAGRHAPRMLLVLLEIDGWTSADDPAAELLDRATADPDGRRLLGVNEHDGTVWFHAESMDAFLATALRTAAVELLVDAASTAEAAERLAPVCAAVGRLAEAVAASECRLEDVRAGLRR